MAATEYRYSLRVLAEAEESDHIFSIISSKAIDARQLRIAAMVLSDHASPETYRLEHKTAEAHVQLFGQTERAPWLDEVLAEQPPEERAEQASLPIAEDVIKGMPKLVVREEKLSHGFRAVPAHAVTLNGMYLPQLNPPISSEYGGPWVVTSNKCDKAVDDGGQRPQIYNSLGECEADVQLMHEYGDHSVCP